jgi:flagellar biosynthesis component FlhA
MMKGLIALFTLFMFFALISTVIAGLSGMPIELAMVLGAIIMVAIIVKQVKDEAERQRIQRMNAERRREEAAARNAASTVRPTAYGGYSNYKEVEREERRAEKEERRRQKEEDEQFEVLLNTVIMEEEWGE